MLGKLIIGERKIESIENSRGHTSGQGLSYLQVDGINFLVGLCSDMWSLQGVSFSKKYPKENLFVFESNSLFHNNPWFFTNLYAWHRVHAYSAGVRMITVPNDSPIWVIDAR
jgi:hypothetical protein